MYTLYNYLSWYPILYYIFYILIRTIITIYNMYYKFITIYDLYAPIYVDNAIMRILFDG